MGRDSRLGTSLTEDEQIAKEMGIDSQRACTAQAAEIQRGHVGVDMGFAAVAVASR
jgi:hypothetical protein